ncbi:MAG TPA: DNA mismatch endonuclease Vsr [Gemmata sp.]|jgi:DNA mismatch endonuclease (patch repair protein)|nr:DNA mismatch endonuclease Vsr [Gemmata sp.]
MADTMTPTERSERMSRVKNKNSKAELNVRSLVHLLGFRYRLHNPKLPGKPDIVLTRHRKIILIHGCYWHQHGVCRPLAIPQNNTEFWRSKFADNVERDKRNLRDLKKLGWKVLVVWECQTGDYRILERKLRRFLRKKE